MDSNVPAMDPRSDEVLHRCSLPLWSHMADASNSCDVQAALVLFQVALNIGAVDPWSPWLHDFPIEFLDPFSSTQERHGSIGVAREKEHFDVILPLEHSVDPERCLILDVPLHVDVFIARLPSRVIIRVELVIDVKNIFNLLVIEVVSNLVSNR